MLEHPYNWDAIDYNANKISEYIRLLAPVAGTTLVKFVFLPVLAGAATFALIGADAATMIYATANGTVLLGGLYRGGKKIYLYNSVKSSDVRFAANQIYNEAEEGAAESVLIDMIGEREDDE